MDVYINKFGGMLNDQFEGVVAAWGAGSMTFVYIFIALMALRSFFAVSGSVDATLSGVLLLTQIEAKWTRARYFYLLCLVCVSFLWQLAWVLLMAFLQDY